MQKDDAISFRVPSALKRALEDVAEADHRSVAQLCTLAVMEYLEKRGEWPRRGRTSERTQRRRVTGQRARRA